MYLEFGVTTLNCHNKFMIKIIINFSNKLSNKSSNKLSNKSSNELSNKSSITSSISPTLKLSPACLQGFSSSDSGS